MVDVEKFAEALFEGSVEKVKTLTREGLDRGEKAEDILNEGLIKAMDQVGLKFKNGEIYIPEVLIAARAMHAGLAVLKPVLAKSGAAKAAKIVIGTVKGDLHDIGKNMVGMMLEGAGFDVVDLGVDVPTEKFVQAAKEHGARVVGMSALLTTTMMQMKATVEALRASGAVKMIVGGAPLTQDFATQIGADGYAPDAASAVERVKELLKQA